MYMQYWRDRGSAGTSERKSAKEAKGHHGQRVLLQDQPHHSHVEHTFSGRDGLPTSSTDGRFPWSMSRPGGAKPWAACALRSSPFLSTLHRGDRPSIVSRVTPRPSAHRNDGRTKLRRGELDQHGCCF